jgi:hypothetical protein
LLVGSSAASASTLPNAESLIEVCITKAHLNGILVLPQL